MLHFRFQKAPLITEERNLQVLYHYRTDLTEKQWQIIKRWISPQKQGPKQVCRRRIINAILYLVRTGCQWRKRHIIVDTLSLILSLVIHSADIQDQEGANHGFHALGERFKRLKVIFADSAYKRLGLPAWVKGIFGWIVQPVLRPVAVKGFVILPKRWMVERTWAWMGKHRRHAKDYERTNDSCKALIDIAMTARMIKLLENYS